MRLSERLPPVLDAATLAEHPRAADVIDLTCGNPSTAGFSWPEEVELGRSGRPYLAQAQGPQSAREAVATTLSTWGRPTSCENVILTAGTSEALGYLLKAVCNPGDHIVTVRPGYPLVEHLAELEGVGVRSARSHCDEIGWSLDLATLEKALCQGARMVVLVSPNNPTGARLEAPELLAVASLCRRFDALCVLDEVFAPFGVAPPHTVLAPLADFDCVVSLGGLSKAGLWPELKLSWMALYGSTGAVERLRCALEWIADAYLSVSQPIAQALPALLARAPCRQAQVRARSDLNARALAAAAVGRVLPRAAGWYAIVRLGAGHPVVQRAARRGKTVARWIEEEAQVAVLPGDLFDLPWSDALVFSLLAPPQTFAAGLARLARAGVTLPHA